MQYHFFRLANPPSFLRKMGTTTEVESLSRGTMMTNFSNGADFSKHYVRSSGSLQFNKEFNWKIWCKFPRKIIKHSHRPKCEYLADYNSIDILEEISSHEVLLTKNVFWSIKTDDHRILQINVKRILLAQINRLIICYLWSKRSCTALCQNTRYVPNWSHETCSFHPHSVNSFSSFLLLG